MPAQPSKLHVPSPTTLAPLIPKYDQPGPRYTSYPPAPHWTSAFDAGAFTDALADSTFEEASIYVHIPFCESLCTYCACNRKISKDHKVAEPFLDTLQREAHALRDALGTPRKAAQVALGGGTPTYLSPDQLRRLAAILDDCFPRADDGERSVEVDPRVTTAAQLDALAEGGFNRISLGVQDLSEKVQRAINRVQSLEQTQGLAEQARARGFRSVNFDLIYGLPYQTVESFRDTLDQVLAVRPDRIALYSYAHVVWVSKQQRGFEKKDLPSAEQKIAIFLTALEKLDAAGYCFLGMDHFALPDDELSRAADRGALWRNFMGYTTRGAEDLLALGPSGITELRGAYAQSVRDVADWQARVESGTLATLRGWRMSPADQRRKWLIQRLMCQGEIDPDGFAARFGRPLDEEIPRFDERMQPFIDDGLLVDDGGVLRTTPVGRILMRPIAMQFDAYLSDRPDGPRYSRVV